MERSEVRIGKTGSMGGGWTLYRDCTNALDKFKIAQTPGRSSLL